jgi:hypothetical protein
MKKLFLIALVPVLLSSCKKDLIEKANIDTTQKVTTEFKKLNVNENFDWNTSSMVDFKVQGMQTLTTINRTLKVSSVAGDVTYFVSTHQMDQNLETKISLPKIVKSVKVSYGTLEKEVTLSSNKINFNFLPASTEE